MVKKKILLIENKKLAIGFFKEMFRYWDLDFFIIEDINSSMIKINVIKPDFILISTDLKFDYKNFCKMVCEKDYGLFFYGEKNLMNEVEFIHNIRGFFSNIFEMNLELLKSVLFNKNYTRILNKEYDSSFTITENILFAEISGLLSYEELLQQKYLLLNSILSNNINGIILKIENLDADYVQLDAKLILLLSMIHENMITETAVKLISADNNIKEWMDRNKNLYNFELIDRPETGIEKIKAFFTVLENIGISTDTLKEDHELLENIYDASGGIVKKAGETFSSSELLQIRRNGSKKLFFQRDLLIMKKSIKDYAVNENLEIVFAQPDKNNENSKRIRLRKNLVLLIEDDAVNQKYAASILDKLDCRVIILDNGKHALKYASLLYPDLILLDLMLPGLNGLEFYKQYLEVKNVYKAPVIVFSAIKIKDVIEPLIAMGVKDYMLKPIGTEAFIEKVKPYL